METPSSYSLRPATPEDLDQVFGIELRCHLKPWSKEGFLSELTKPYSHFLLLTDDETDRLILGYVVFWVLDESIQIHNLVVDQPFQKKGLGIQILRKVISEGIRNHCKTAVLEVRKSNLAALQLYQKIGFNITQVCKNFYSDGEDAYRMSLELQGGEVIAF